MSIQNENYELEKIKKMITTLEQYRPEETIGGLPVDIKAAIKQIKIIDPITSAGLERIQTVIKDLYFAKYALEKEINSYYTQSKAPQMQNKTKEISSQEIKKKPAVGPQPKSKISKKGPQAKSSFH